MWSAQGRFRNGPDLSLGLPLDWRRADVVLPSWPHALSCRPDLREDWDRAVLAWLRQPDAPHALALRHLSLELSHGQANLPWRAFWKIAAAFFELRSQLASAEDQEARKLVLQLLLQCVALLSHQSKPSEELVAALLRHCQGVAAQAQALNDAPLWQGLELALGLGVAATRQDWLSLADHSSQQLESMLSARHADLQLPAWLHAASLAWALAVHAEDCQQPVLADYSCQLAQALQAASRAHTPEQAQLLADAARHLRQLLHQDAAGIAKRPQEELVQSLRELARTTE